VNPTCQAQPGTRTKDLGPVTQPPPPPTPEKTPASRTPTASTTQKANGERKANGEHHPHRGPPGGPGVAPPEEHCEPLARGRKAPSIVRRRVATGANHPASRSSAFRRGPGTPAVMLRRGTRASI